MLTWQWKDIKMSFHLCDREVRVPTDTTGSEADQDTGGYLTADFLLSKQILTQMCEACAHQIQTFKSIK